MFRLSGLVVSRCFLFPFLPHALCGASLHPGGVAPQVLVMSSTSLLPAYENSPELPAATGWERLQGGHVWRGAHPNKGRGRPRLSCFMLCKGAAAVCLNYNMS